MTIRRTIRVFRATVCVALFAALVSGCAGIKTGSHYDETANFSANRTFAWVADDPYVTADSSIRISPLTQEKIQVAIRDQLIRAGYKLTESSQSADMLIAFTVGTREKISVDSYPVDYPGAWGWHLHGSTYVVREYSEHRYTEGALGVDIFDGGTFKPIWHGWAETVINDKDRENPNQLIEDSVSKLFATFPK
jgi:hypothetical protein